MERKVKRLKNDLSGAKQIIDTLNLRLSDAEEENEKLKASLKLLGEDECFVKLLDDLIQVAEVGSEQSVNAWNEYVSLVHIREIINE